MESYESSNATALPPVTHDSAKRGTRVAMAIGILFALGLAGLIGVRVKQALAKKAALVDQRVAAQASAAAKPARLTVHPEATTFKPEIEVTGTLQPWRSADVGFELGGRLDRLFVSTGSSVHEGQTLAILEGSSAAAQVLQAEASARAAEAQLALADDTSKRSDALAQSKSIPEQQAEQAKHQADLARAQLEAARASAKIAQTGVGNHAVVAPFSGLVTKAPTSAGGVVQPGTPLMQIEDLTRFRLSASLGEDDVSLVRLGVPVTVVTRERTVIGKVITIVPSLDQATRRAPIEVEVPNDPKAPLLAWSFVRATLDSGQDVQALKIPGSARRPGSQNEVVVMENGKARIARVVHSTAPDGSWLVRSGLSAIDTVVLDPDPETKDGDPVSVASGTTAAVTNK
ncbi:MAG: efflux RND transporter periplasmic adaptor subunit [Polyangiaceae bacterium]